MLVKQLNCPLQGRRQKNFWGVSKISGVSKTAGGLESTAPQTLKGISHFCTTFVVFFTKLTNDGHK